MLTLNFTDLDTSYPIDMHPCDGPWDNQCAIRMSLSLIGAGAAFASYTEPKCAHGHARGAESLANWLSSTTRLGRPSRWTDGSVAKSALADKTGIIFFKDCFQRSSDTSFETRRGDHIDLWNKGTTKTYNDPSNNARAVWFWEIA